MFNLFRSTPPLEKLPKRLLQVLHQQSGNRGTCDARALLNTVKSVRRQFYFRMWLAVLPCTILYTVLFFAMCAGLIASIVAVWDLLSQKLLYLLFPIAFLLALIIRALLFVTIVPFIFVNPMQRVALNTLRKQLVRKLNNRTQYSTSPIEFRMIVCTIDKVIYHQEPVPADRPIDKGSNSDFLFLGFILFCLGSSNNSLNGNVQGGLIICVVLIIVLFLFSFICVCAGVSLLDPIIDRTGIPYGLLLEVWLKPTSPEVSSNDMLNGQSPYFVSSH